MKVIAINRDQFYAQPLKAWAEISYAMNCAMDVPIFIDEVSIKQSSKPPVVIPDVPALAVTEYLTDDLQLEKRSCYKMLDQSRQNMLCLDVRGLSVAHVVTIADNLAQTTYSMKSQSMIYLLLVDDLSGADMAEYWYKEFYIEPYPLQQLQPYLNHTLTKMRIRAFVLRYFGRRAEKLLRRAWQLVMKVRRR